MKKYKIIFEEKGKSQSFIVHKKEYEKVYNSVSKLKKMKKFKCELRNYNGA